VIRYVKNIFHDYSTNSAVTVGLYLGWTKPKIRI